MIAESNELQVVEKITTEIDEAQIKVVLATQCIKAQAFLVEKLKRQIKHSKETCGFISSANLKLQSEITQAEQEIKSLQIAKNTIKIANVELKKEWLVAKDNKIDITERVRSGEKKYEELWLECKSRYESLPYVQKLLKAAGTAQTLKVQLTGLDKQTETLCKEIKAKTEACLIVDRKRIIQLAEFMVHERPKLINEINEKSKAITELTNEIKTCDKNSVLETKALQKKKLAEEKPKATEKVDDKNIDENDSIMPKLQLGSLEFDDLISIKLDQVKQVNYTAGLKKKESITKSYFDIGTSIFTRNNDNDESISSYFFKSTAMNEENKCGNYSRKKLINILEDVQIDASDAMNMISKANIDTLKPVETISVEVKTHISEDTGVMVTRNEVTEPMQIEEIDVASTNEDDNIVKPSTQFLDASLKTQKSQEAKKTVSFELSSTAKDSNSDKNKSNAHKENANENKSQDSAGADDGFTKIKDMVLKKHNLDLTPPFVYAKKRMIQIKPEEKVVTSKFFKNNKAVEDETENKQNMGNIKIPQEIEKHGSEPAQENPSKNIELDREGDIVMVSSPKEQNTSNFIDEMSKPFKPFEGYLYGQGTQGLQESMDVSMSTTGFEDMDSDFPHCIDSSLLLSPKADLPACSDNPESQSQKPPNFLSGIRKTGLSFFGLSPGDSKPESNATTQGSSGFNFNFGGEEKKNRGGLFSMFQ